MNITVTAKKELKFGMMKYNRRGLFSVINRLIKGANYLIFYIK